METNKQVAGDDRMILSGIRRKDPHVLNEVLSRFLQPVSRTSYRILCDRGDSESVTISLFVAMWNDPGAFGDDDSLEEAVIRHTCRLCRLRLLRRRLLMLFSITPDVYVSAIPLVPGADDIISRLAWTLYCRAAGNYSDRQRLVFALCELEGYTVDMTARMISLMETQVHKALQSAREMLRDELDRFGRMDDYMAYIGFLRKIEDQLTDTVRLKRIITAALPTSRSEHAF